MSIPVPVGRVLPTMNEDGSRRWIRPKPSYGRHYARRRNVAYGLIVIFFLIPFVKLNGMPLILLDLPRREFTLFGRTYLPTDTLLLMLFVASIIITIFLLTALFGRVWCGWACPQTVYMEWVFRPIERLFEGGRSGSLQLDRQGWRGQLVWRRLGKHAAFGVLALFAAHTFLAYFVGVDELAVWVRRSPVEHPTSFAVMAITTLAMFADFAWFREQSCLVACPYGRIQSALLDRHSLIVAYDHRRGEPRAKGKQKTGGAGDCIDCGACVLTCPTGIDIRDGLQMECIHCTQCADACDEIMDKVNRPKGLIRYSSQAVLAGAAPHRLRPRTVLYPAALALTFGGFLLTLGTRPTAEVTVLRGQGDPYVVQEDGRVSNQLRVKITNRAGADRDFTVAIDGIESRGGALIAPQNPLHVARGATEISGVFVLLPREDFEDGEREVTIRVTDATGYAMAVRYTLVGPEHDEDGRDDRERRGGDRE